MFSANSAWTNVHPYTEGRQDERKGEDKNEARLAFHKINSQLIMHFIGRKSHGFGG